MPEFTGRSDSGTAGQADEMVPRLLRAAREHLAMDVSFVSEFSEGRRTFRYVDGSGGGVVQVGGSDPLEESYCGRVVDGRLPQLIHDARDLPAAAELPATAAVPVGAHLSVPLVLSDGRLYGTFCCFRHTGDHSLGDRDLGVVAMFADLARQYIEADLESTERQAAARGRIGAALTTEGYLTTAFQPVVDLAEGEVVGMEALSRFPREYGRSPDLWFAEAASIGLGPELEVLALRTAVAALPRFPETMFMAVNVSPETVGSGRVDDVLADVDATRLVLEMTEHAPVADYDQLNAALRPLRRRGARVAIDDAGAGYASLRHILRLEPEWIKIDSSITRDVDTDPARFALATAMVNFAGGIGSSIVAEGIETAAELDAMRSLGVTAGQGYHLGRPAELAQWEPVAAAAG